MLSLAQVFFWPVLGVFYVCSAIFLIGDCLKLRSRAADSDCELVALVVFLYYGLLLFYLSTLSVHAYFAVHGAIFFVLIGFAIWRWRGFVDRLRQMKLYVLCTLAVIYFSFFLFVPETVGHNIAVRIWPSVDNHLSLIASERFFQFGRGYLFSELLPKVPITDRSLISFGFLDFSFYVAHPQLNHFIFGVALQMTWVVVVTNIYRRRQDTEAAQFVQLLLMLLSGIVWFYSIYTWYKILAAGVYVLCIVLACEARKRNHYDNPSRRLIEAAIPPALLLCVVLHGSYVYAAIAFIIVFPRQTLNPRGLLICLPLVASLAVILISMPPSGQMVKWHVMGEPDGFDESYLQLWRIKFANVWELISFKVNNFTVTVLPWQTIQNVVATRPGHQTVSVYIRYVQLYSLFFAPGLLWLTLAFRAPGKADPLDRWLVLTLVVSIVVTNLIEYGGPLATSMSLAILHHRPFSECFVMVFLLAGYARNLRRSRQWGLLAAMAVFFVIVWVPRSDINGDVYPLNWLYLGTGIFILLGSAAFLLRQKRFTSSFNEADAR